MEFSTINGINVYHFVNSEQLLEYASERSGILVAVNAEKIMKAPDELREIINRNIGYADGVGAVMALRQRGFRGAVKIPGCELWLDIIARSYRDKRFYFVGGTQATIDRTLEKLRSDYPGIRVAGYRNGYLGSRDDEDALIEDIALQKPDIVFVAMGSPKQELLMSRALTRHKALYQGLGGSFDVYVGNVKRAPRLFVGLGLEWLYRLLRQPTRVSRQVVLLKFMYALRTGKL